MAGNLLRKLAVHYIAPHYPLRPTSLTIIPTLRCSSRCAHCTIWTEAGRGKTELTPQQWEKLFSDPIFGAAQTFWLSGGEPTLRPDLDRIALAAIDKLPALKSMTLATNALDPDAIKTFLKNALPAAKRVNIYTHLHISLDGPPEVHDKIRGVEEAYHALEKTVGLAKEFIEKGYPLGYSFNCVIQELNADSLEKTLETARELGGNITFNLADESSGFYRSRPLKTKGLSPLSEQRAAKFIKNLAAKSDPYHRRHYESVLETLLDKPRRDRCETLEAAMYLDSDASIFPCPRSYASAEAIHELPLRKAWKKIFKERRRIRAELCPTCSLGCSFGEGITIGEFIKLLR